MYITCEVEKTIGISNTYLNAVYEAISIFSKHQDYADEDEMKRGAYLREYKALLSYLDR